MQKENKFPNKINPSGDSSIDFAFMTVTITTILNNKAVNPKVIATRR